MQLRSLGVPYDPETAAAVDHAEGLLRKVRDNMGYFLNADGRPVKEVLDYGMTWGWWDRERSEKMIALMVDPTWRAYQACYSHGHELCAAYVGSDLARFRRLLTTADARHTCGRHRSITPADFGETRRDDETGVLISRVGAKIAG